MLANCCTRDTIVARRQPSRRNPRLDRREVAISRHSMPELRLGLWPSPNRGRRESRVPTDTRGLVCQTHSNRRTRAYRFSRNSPAFPTQWSYGLLRALPGERALLPPSPCEKLPARLSASIAAPGPHDFAVRLGVFVRR